MADASIRHDEPTSIDGLGRQQYVNALARLAETCETPLVVGLYGTWGIGKTSMMRQIRARLDEDETVKTVWFDPWQHQFDDNPVLALLHTALKDLDEATRENLKGTLLSLATAVGSMAMKALTNIDISHVRKIVDQVEEERFLLRERQVRLREHFEAIIEAVRGQHQKRVVFFIDDLDRCIPKQILSLLEALKLYLNLEGCVYFLGLDREPVEQSIRHEYAALVH